MLRLTTTPRHTALHIVPRYLHRLAAMSLHQLKQSFRRMLCQGLQGDVLVEEGTQHIVEEGFSAYRREIVRDVHCTYDGLN